MTTMQSQGIIERLRERIDQEHDGEATLTAEELTALLAIAEEAIVLAGTSFHIRGGQPGFAALRRLRVAVQDFAIRCE